MHHLKKNLYFDYAATTPMDKEVIKVMEPYFSEDFGNPMSLHSFGQSANLAIEEARKKVADFLGANSKEIFFTSGATESNNLTVRGTIKAFKKLSKQKPHIITSSFEHHCVLSTCEELEKSGEAEVTFIKPNEKGIIDPEEVRKSIKKNTLLVSIMYVNNEIGTVQPIEEIGAMLKKVNPNILFHTDATQAVNYLEIDVKKLNLDLLSLSAHKIYGPKGVGALFIKEGTLINPVQTGGDQESGKRAGTHNVPGIVGLGKAISAIKKDQPKNNKKLSEIRDYLIQKVLKEIPDTWLNGDPEKRTPNNINFGFKSVEGEALILMLDSYGIAASTGSACSSGSLNPSHVLLSLGLKPEEAHGSLRITLGKYTQKKDAVFLAKTLKKVIKELRKISGSVLDDYYKKNQI